MRKGLKLFDFLGYFGTVFQNFLSEKSKELIISRHMVRQMKFFEDSRLMKEDWKGSLKPVDVLLLIIRNIKENQMNQKLRLVLEKMKFLPMQKSLKKSSKSRKSMMNLPPPRRAGFLGDSSRKTGPLDFFTSNTLKILEKNNTLAEPSGTRI